MANGGIIGPIKVVCTPSTKTTSVTSTGDFVRQNCQVTSVSALVIGGGGGSGHGNSDSFAGAGGAGGYRFNTCISISSRCTPVTIGAGGAGGTTRDGSTGSNSVFGPLTSNGGGGGGGIGGQSPGGSRNPGLAGG